MKRLPRSVLGKNGFTLVEILVSISVLSVLLVGMASVTNFVAQTWLAGVNSNDNFTKGRVVLNLLDRDIQMMVLRSDLPAFVDASGNPAPAFYTNVEGNQGTDAGNTRSVSLVQYLLASSTTAPTLQRINCGMNFLPGSGITPTIGASSLTQLGNVNAQTDTVFKGIIHFQIQFIDGSGTILTPPYSLSSTPPASSSPPTAPTPFWFDYANPSGSYNPRVAVVSMVVLSNSAYDLAKQDGTVMSHLLADFPTTAPTNQTYSEVWNNVLNPSTGTFDASLPAPLRESGGIQVFERHVPLPLITPSN
jgi:prepilin-type N-terminal cleavage/methylation domain-containing protein